MGSIVYGVGRLRAQLRSSAGGCLPGLRSTRMAADTGPVDSERIAAIKALPVGDRLRVIWLLRWGKAPKDRQWAAAAAAMAEGFQRAHGRAYWVRLRWFALFVMVVTGSFAVWFATGGATLQAISNAALALVTLISLIISPMFWPKNVARSLEASRAVVGSGE